MSFDAPRWTTPLECSKCTLGCAALEAGEFCPLISRRYDKDAVVAEAGTPADYIWFVKRGAVASGVGPGEPIESLHLPGSFVALEGLLTDTRQSTSWTLEPSELCGATAEGLREWMKHHPEQRAAIELMAAEVHAQQEALLEARRLSTDETTRKPGT